MKIETDQIPAREIFLPFSRPSIGEEEIAEVVDSLRSGWITTGPKVRQFESAFATYVGTQHAIAVSSCTAGLHIALTALGVGPGDEVIVPTLTFCATANVVVHLGARPVLVDVAGDFNVTFREIEKAITPRTRAIMPVHFAGQSCDLESIYQLAAHHNLAIVEDAAHAVGASWHSHPIGSDALQSAFPDLRRVTVFSFYPTKNMTTGEGGMITTMDDSLAQQMRLLTLHGMSRDAWKRYSGAGSWYYEVMMPGYKANMTDIQASLGIHQLSRLNRFIEIRQRYAQLYRDALADLPEIESPPAYRDRTHVYHIFVIKLRLDLLNIDRARFIEELKNRNIGTSVHFIPVHVHPYYQDQFGYRRGDFPMAEALYDRIISLPLYPLMTEGDAEDVIRAVRQVIQFNRREKT